jgi:hypothetical protein
MQKHRTYRCPPLPQWISKGGPHTVASASLGNLYKTSNRRAPCRTTQRKSGVVLRNLRFKVFQVILIFAKIWQTSDLIDYCKECTYSRTAQISRLWRLLTGFSVLGAEFQREARGDLWGWERMQVTYDVHGFPILPQASPAYFSTCLSSKK